MGKYYKIDMKDLKKKFTYGKSDFKDANKVKDIKEIKKLLIQEVCVVILVCVTLLSIRPFDFFYVPGLWKYILWGLITGIYIILCMVNRDNFFKNILFAYKNILMDRYYSCLNGDEKIYGIENVKFEPNDNQLIPVTANGELIGVIEMLLYGIAIIVKSPALIGIILAVRSYVSVASHSNKEESEFYIIGLLGSLLHSIVATLIYVLLIDVIFKVNLFQLVDIMLTLK